ncbi:MAG: hypothetical protein WDA16_10950 [Candidatus Thermoplasmatota archaeon]
MKDEPVYNPDDAIPGHVVGRYIADGVKHRRPKSFHSVYRIADLLDERERRLIYNCYRAVGIFSTDQAPKIGTMHGLRCRQALCPACASIEGGVRTHLWYKKFASLEPAAAGAEIVPARHIVLTFAPEAWDWIVAHRSTALPELQQAWMTTLAKAYDIHSQKEGRSKYAAFRVAAHRFSGVLSAHCITEEPHPQWPKAKPHFDIMLSGMEVEGRGKPDAKMVYSARGWPESFKHKTSRTWAREFTKALIRAEAPIEIMLAADAHERLSVTVGPMSETNQTRGHIKYCLRAMIDLQEAWTAINPETERLQLHYPVYKKNKKPYTHVVDADLFLSKYWQLRAFIDGTENQRGFGGLAKNPYTSTVKISGKPPVLSEKAKDDPTRKKMRKGYRQIPGEPGKYALFDPRDRATG